MRLTDFLNDSDASETKLSKIWFLSIFFGVVFAVYLFRLFSMQVLEENQYRNQLETNSQRVKEIPAQRGEIYDRNATLPIVLNTDSFAVDIIPGEIPNGLYDTVTSRLASFLSIKKSDIDKKIASNERRSYQSFEIKANVPFDVISNIAENLVDLPGVSWRSKPIRNYAVSGSISHVLGYVGDITQDELNVLYNKGYTKSSIVGKTGVERQYDDLLQGEAGSEMRTVDARGRTISAYTITKEPKMGKNLVLTIDSDIQKLAEEALGERIGSAIVLKPSTGEVLAMASYPYYDLNIFSTDNAGTEYAKLLNDPNKPLINRAIYAEYPPASTFKVIMSAALLQEKTFDSAKKIECAGFVNYGNRAFRCHIGVPGHGHLDLRNGLAQSCNVYYWTIGRDYLGVDKIASYAREFGLGQSFEIDLPAQASGFVPTPQWKERTYHEKWLGGDTLNMSIGQSYTLVTPMHVANMMAMVVNEGVIYKPHVLKEVRDPVTKEVIDTVEREVLFSSDIDKAVWKELKTDLRYTVTNGSAQFPLRNKVVQIAGKTGTGEISGYTKQWHSWFVAYGPFDAPKEEAIVVVVSVEAVNTWEWWAPYASNIIFQGIFANQTYDEAIDALGFKYLKRPVGRQE